MLFIDFQRNSSNIFVWMLEINGNSTDVKNINLIFLVNRARASHQGPVTESREYGNPIPSQNASLHSMTILDILIIGVKCMKNDQKMIRKQFEVFPALLQLLQ